MPHDELDQLSAYLDGELEESERARLDAHLPGCAECRTTIDALRATLTDLKALPEPVPTEQDSWALRSAIARARKPSKRWPRIAVAAGTAAAAVIAFAVFTHPSKSGSGTDALSGGAKADRAVPVYAIGSNFTPLCAQAHLLDVAGVVPGAGTASCQKLPVQKAFPGGGNQTPVEPRAQAGAPLAATALSSGTAPVAELDRCAGIVKSSTQELLTPVRYEVVTFESKPAFFLFFSTTDRYELWVVTRDKCDVVFFFQTH